MYSISGTGRAIYLHIFTHINKYTNAICTYTYTYTMHTHACIPNCHTPHSGRTSCDSTQPRWWRCSQVLYLSLFSPIFFFLFPSQDHAHTSFTRTRTLPLSHTDVWRQPCMRHKWNPHVSSMSTHMLQVSGCNITCFSSLLLLICISVCLCLCVSLSLCVANSLSVCLPDFFNRWRVHLHSCTYMPLNKFMHKKIGTDQGDAAENNAVKTLFGTHARTLCMSSNKGSIGKLTHQTHTRTHTYIHVHKPKDTQTARSNTCTHIISYFYIWYI